MVCVCGSKDENRMDEFEGDFVRLVSLVFTLQRQHSFLQVNFSKSNQFIHHKVNV